MAATVVDATGTPTYSRSDANGNTAAINAGGQLTTYTWDIEDHITGVQLPGGSRNTFSYDGDGKRRRMEESATARDLLRDGENILREQDGAALVAQYTHAPERGVHPERSEWGSLVSQRRGNATSYHHFDALGSTRALTNAAQTATGTADYKAFGLTNASPGATTNPFRWVGRLGYYHQPDSSDYWLRARTFRPTMGRFISQDPIRQMNLYAFPSNSPVMMVDPSGRQGCASGARNGGSSSTDELISIGGPPATFRPQYQCENQPGFCCEVPWGYGPPRTFVFTSYTMKKNVWHTDIKCGCSWVPVDLDTGGRGGGGGGEERGKVEGSCSARAHRQTLKLVGGEVVHASPEMKRRVKGTCVKPREGETCIKPPEPTDVCGPDVTLALQNTVTRIRSVFNGWGVVEQSVKCTVGPWGFMWGNGWDIHELYVGAFGGYQSGRCASGVCERTVTVDHKCFHDWAVNYVAFGLMTRLCADAHLLPMKWLSLLTSEGIAWFVNAIMFLVDPAEYKYGDNAEKEPWVVAGFNYWPASAAPSAPSSTQDCSKCPLPPVPNRIFGWHWNGYKEGE